MLPPLDVVRPLRILISDGVYHVTARGIERRAIYADDQDRFAFLAVLEKTVDRFAWQCLAYCLMPNHFHLLVETPEPNLARGMQQLNGRYAQGFNKRHGRDGALFGGRYKAKLIQRDAHLLAVFRYIALNPVGAGLCESPSQWYWSAHRAIAGEASSSFLAVGKARSWFASLVGGDGATAYRDFVANANDDEDGDERVAIGDADYLRAVLPATSPGPEFRKRDWGAGRPTLATLLADGPDPVSIARAYRLHGYTLSDIAALLGCHVSTVSRRIKAHERDMLECKI
jgi:putative transposase